jgi:2-dehydropantoate 2-reductase
MPLIRIGVLGLGGVGGYFGGLLAEKYHGSDSVEVIFIVRKGSERLIGEHGLKLIIDAGERIIHPHKVVADTDTIGVLDYLFCCTKGYDLEEALKPLNKCITRQTVLLPLLNGVDARERIQNIFPQAQTWNGCVYIVARRLEPGVIKQTGNIHMLYFGSDQATPERLQQLEQLMLGAGIDARLSANIELTAWEKYFFISPFATLTTFLDLHISEVLNSPKHFSVLVQLMQELKLLSIAKQIPFPDNIIDLTLEKMKKIPHGSLSSMHSDFLKGGKTELSSLTEYVVHQGRRYSVPTPTYTRILNGILARRLKLDR